MPRKYFAIPVLLALALATGTARPAAGATEPAPSFFTLHDLGHGVWAAISPPNSKAGANAGFVIGPDGVLVIDTFEDPAAASAMLDAIRTKTREPARYVIDTHYHLDHTAGNNVFAAAGATVMAQQNVRTWERTQNLKFFGAHPTAQQKQFVRTLGLPSVTYKDDITLWLGDRKVIVRTLEGHTGSDSSVVIPDAGVVFTGDIFWNHTLPNLIDANTRQQIASNDAYLRDYPGATFVPGHGGLGKAADVRAFRDYLVALRGDIAVAQAAGKSGGALVDSVLPELEGAYGSWGWFKHFAPRNIAQTAAELPGTKQVPVPGTPSRSPNQALEALDSRRAILGPHWQDVFQHPARHGPRCGTWRYDPRMQFVFTKGSGRHDRMDIMRGDGSVEHINCPKQRIIPHDMVHCVVEGTLARRGFVTRVRDGERADVRMRGEAESDGVERLVEVIQGDAWSGGSSDATEMLDLYRVTCDARGCPMLDVSADDLDAVRARMAELTKRWEALPVGQSLAVPM